MDWTAVLHRARTVAEVLEVMDEFLSSVDDEYWRSVPESLRRPVIVADVDLERWHHQLVKQLADKANPSKPFQELARVSLHAVARMHQIKQGAESRHNDDDGYSARRCA